MVKHCSSQQQQLLDEFDRECRFVAVQKLNLDPIMLQIFISICVAAAAEPVVKILNGSYSGVHLPQLDQDLFLGIPYAQGGI